MGDREQSDAGVGGSPCGGGGGQTLERFAVVRRGRDGVDKHPASGLLVVGFDHRVSRPGDPLLHTHGIVVNRALGPDGRWTAPDARRCSPR